MTMSIVNVSEDDVAHPFLPIVPQAEFQEVRTGGDGTQLHPEHRR
jgi:hypothetical protein